MATDSQTEISPVDFIQLQECIEYSRMKVNEAMMEFGAGGKLAHHRLGDRTDALGFSLFLRLYLEADLTSDLYPLPFDLCPLPSDLCHRLFCSFQRSEHTDDGVSLKAVSCFFSVLEEGNPRDKLEYTFRLYDKDDNGVLDRKEFDKIITQMMKAAEYLGWDVTELEPVLLGLLRAVDSDADGAVSLQEWTRAGLGSAPLQVLLGLKVPERDGHHAWRMKSFRRPAFCCVCRRLLLGLRRQGLCCRYCKFTAHSGCASASLPPCARTVARSTAHIGCSAHDWISVDRESDSCEVCLEPIRHLAGQRCVWCQRMRHLSCVPLGSSSCDCGLLRDHILPPWAICPVDPAECRSPGASGDNDLLNMNTDGHFLKIFPVEDTHPLLVFVNPKSGGKQGKRVLRKFQFLLNPRQVFSLDDGGPHPGLHFFQNVPSFRVLVCGGDGTVGWVLDAIDKAALVARPPVAILPLGTGNDLARSLHWGGGYEGGDLQELLKRVKQSSETLLDRWSVSIAPADPDAPGDPAPTHTFNNYFSIGVDASIAQQFHTMREKQPQKFSSRIRNKLCYFQLATSESISASCRNLSESVSIECGGAPLDLIGRSLEGVAVLNIPSMHGGSNLWGESRRSEPRREETHDPEELETRTQDMGDELLELVGLEGVLEMGQLYAGVKSKAQRLLQAAHLTIRTSRALPMQIDGEPWLQSPCTITITHLTQALMLKAPAVKPSALFLK